MPKTLFNFKFYSSISRVRQRDITEIPPSINDIPVTNEVMPIAEVRGVQNTQILHKIHIIPHAVIKPHPLAPSFFKSNERVVCDIPENISHKPIATEIVSENIWSLYLPKHIIIPKIKDNSASARTHPAPSIILFVAI